MGPLEVAEGPLEFDPGEVNLRLAKIARCLRNQRPRPIPIVGTLAIDEALRQVSGGAIGVDYLAEDVSVDLVGRGAGTSGEVRKTAQVMRDKGYKRPIFLAQAYHVGRVTLHARNEKIYDYVVPEGLPKSFRKDSRQPWIRNQGLWIFRELCGAPFLWAQGKV